MLKNNEVINNAAWLSLAYLLNRGTLILVVILIARYFSVLNFNLFSYFQVTLTMVGGYIAMGLGLTATRYFATLNEQDLVQKRAFLFLMLIVLAVAVISIVIMPSSVLFGNLSIRKVDFAFAVAFVAWNVIPNGALVGVQAFRYLCLSALLSSLVLLIGIGIAIYLNSINLAIYSLIISLMVQTILETLKIAKFLQVNPLKDFAITWIRIKQILKFSLPLALSSILIGSVVWIMSRRLIAGDEHSYAIFIIGLQWYALASFIPSMAGRVLIPYITKLIDNNISNSILLKTTLINILLVISVIIFVMILVAVFYPIIIALYGSHFMMTRWLLCCYIAAAILPNCAAAVGTLLLSIDKTDVWSMMVIIWFVIILILCYLFLPSNNLYIPIIILNIGGLFLLAISLTYIIRNLR